MLNIYKSNRMEYLMDALASVIEDPLGDPFLSEWIVIQSRGMKQWISIELARRTGICANISCFFPRDLIEKFVSKSGFEENLLFWKIMELLPILSDHGKFSIIKSYLKNDKDGVKLYQLACNIADLFDNYSIYRPDLLLKWQNRDEDFYPENKLFAWQPVLFRELIQSGLEYSIPGIKEREDIPQRISAFGISSYPPMFLNFFNDLGKFSDINLFLLVPSKEFFGYSISGYNQDIEPGNRLVASLGRAGRDMQVMMEEFDYYEPFPDMWHDPLYDSETMLSYLQSDILHLYERKPGKDMEPVDISFENDNSISIHACHTPMREVQVLKDQLLDLFEACPELNPGDVIVMMPDIESYAPLIEAVFSVEHKFSFSISDRRQKSESETVKAFLKVLDIVSSRFELHLVLDLLSMSPVAEKFSIDHSGLALMEQYVESAGIRWGIDSEQKNMDGFPVFFENTFRFGLERLVLGYAMPENHDRLFLNVLPKGSVQGAQAENLGRFIQFTRTLFKMFRLLHSRNKDISYFCKSFKQVVSCMIAKTSENKSDYLFIMDTLQQMEDEAAKAVFDREISFDVAREIVKKRLGQSVSAGSFMTGGITFCNLMPMRSIPFKVVGLMGMGEQDFPRKSFSGNFDLIDKFPRTGDKNIRNQDRYLFLEALISARKNLIITYTGFNIRDNSSLPCSAVVSELIDVIKESFNIKSEQDLIHYHPLQPFSPKYFNMPDKGGLFSFSLHAFNIAKKLSKRSDVRKPFINRELSLFTMPRKNISLMDMDSFFSHPLAYMMKNRLGIKIPQPEQIHEDREPVVLNQFDKYQIGSDILLKGVEQNCLTLDYNRFKASGMLPFGKKGRVDLEEIYILAEPVFQEAEEIISRESLEPEVIKIDFGDINVSGTIDMIRKDTGRFIITFGIINPRRLLNAWIYHLALNAACEDTNGQAETILMGRSPGKGRDKTGQVCFPGMDKNDAYTIMNDLVECYKSGLDKPFIFFPDTSHGFVKLFLESDQDMSEKNIKYIMQKCKGKWFNSFLNTGDKLSLYTDKFFSGLDLFDDIDLFIQSHFIENSIKIFKPMMECME